MKYRLLKIGDIFQDDDEWLHPVKQEWFPVESFLIGLPMIPLRNDTSYRRKIKEKD